MPCALQSHCRPGDAPTVGQEAEKAPAVRSRVPKPASAVSRSHGLSCPARGCPRHVAYDSVSLRPSQPPCCTPGCGNGMSPCSLPNPERPQDVRRGPSRRWRTAALSSSRTACGSIACRRLPILTNVPGESHPTQPPSLSKLDAMEQARRPLQDRRVHPLEQENAMPVTDNLNRSPIAFEETSTLVTCEGRRRLSALTHCPAGAMFTSRPPRRRAPRIGGNTMRCALVPAVSAIALLLAGCSTMNVTLEKSDDGPTVSAVATAPTSTSIRSLIEDTHAAMAAACASEKGTQATVQFLDEANEAISGATKAAKGIKELLDAVRSWFPENTFTATRLCRGTNHSDQDQERSPGQARPPSDAKPS